MKILKSHEDLQKFILKADEDDLNDFKSNSKSSKSSLKSFKDASEREIKFQNSNENLNED